MEESSISSEYSSDPSLEPVICHIKERQITNQQPWSTEEIILALSDLPAGKHALSIIPTLHGDILDKVLHEFLNIDNNKMKNIQKTPTPSFADGYTNYLFIIIKIIINIIQALFNIDVYKIH